MSVQKHFFQLPVKLHFKKYSKQKAEAFKDLDDFTLSACVTFQNG